MLQAPCCKLHAASASKRSGMHVHCVVHYGHRCMQHLAVHSSEQSHHEMPAPSAQACNPFLLFTMAHHLPGMPARSGHAKQTTPCILPAAAASNTLLPAGHMSSAPAPGGQGQESYSFYNVKRYRPYFNVDTTVGTSCHRRQWHKLACMSGVALLRFQLLAIA